MKQILNLKTVFIISFVFLYGCVENVKNNTNDITIWNLKPDELKKIPSEPVPVLVLTKEESAAFLDQWSDTDGVAERESNMPEDVQSKFRILTMLWGISNENLCSSYNLVSIKKQALQYTEISTRYEGILKFNPISYSEIWDVNMCGKTKKWQVADNNGDFSIHAILAD